MCPISLGPTLRLSLSGTFWRKDVVNQCLEFAWDPHSAKNTKDREAVQRRLAKETIWSRACLILHNYVMQYAALHSADNSRSICVYDDCSVVWYGSVVFSLLASRPNENGLLGNNVTYVYVCCFRIKSFLKTTSTTTRGWLHSKQAPHPHPQPVLNLTSTGIVSRDVRHVPGVF